MTNGQTTRTIVWAVVALFIGTMATVVLLVVFAPEERAGALVAQVIGASAPVLAVLAAMRQVAAVDHKVSQVERDTHALTNGLLDAKVRAGVAEVLPDDQLDPDYTTRRADDRAAVDEWDNRK